ncbi:MAG: hypothetical protein ACUVWR_15615 [Anaerolineae bacterium]
MRLLKILDFDKKQLGAIRMLPDGQLQLEVSDKGQRHNLEAFLKRITSEPAYLTGGERSEVGGKTTFITRRRQVRPGDTDFLAGVQELLNKTRFGSTRVRRLLVGERKP